MSIIIKDVSQSQSQVRVESTIESTVKSKVESTECAVQSKVQSRSLAHGDHPVQLFQKHVEVAIGRGMETVIRM